LYLIGSIVLFFLFLIAYLYFSGLLCKGTQLSEFH
jgi:hypothetical protein